MNAVGLQDTAMDTESEDKENSNPAVNLEPVAKPTKLG